uniref:Fibroblast growth factor n=1 Tax=Anopheles epiroticus TaxID=199890 RepID=A0A182P6R6_9DIPT
MAKKFTDDCIFNEQMEQHHYNTYSSTQHSNGRRTLYLALNKTGQPRKIQIPVNRTLGKLATYTKALTQTVAHDRVEQLISRLFGADHVRHGLNQLCEAGQPLVELTAKEMRPRPVCGPTGPKGAAAIGGGAGGAGGSTGGGKKNGQQGATGKDEKEGLRQKKKKKRRKCREDEVPGEHCFRPGGAAPGTGPKPTKKLAGGGSRNGSTQQPPAGSSRKPKKPNQQQQPGANGKRNGTGGSPAKASPAKIKLVGASIVTSKLSHPKPASLTIARTVRPTLATPRPTDGRAMTTVSNDLQDASAQSDDSELELDDALQASAELVDELDELDEGNLTVPGHAINFVDEDDLDDMEF